MASPWLFICALSAFFVATEPGRADPINAGREQYLKLRLQAEVKMVYPEHFHEVGIGVDVQDGLPVKSSSLALDEASTASPLVEVKLKIPKDFDPALKADLQERLKNVLQDEGFGKAQLKVAETASPPRRARTFRWRRALGIFFVVASFALSIVAVNWLLMRLPRFGRRREEPSLNSVNFDELPSYDWSSSLKERPAATAFEEPAENSRSFDEIL